MTLMIARAQQHEASVVEHLLQLHLYEAGAEPGPDGLIDWGEPLDRFFSDPECLPLLLREADGLVGFALVKLRRRLADADGRSPIVANLIDEFFILRSHRGRGLGTLAAGLILDQYPGRWIVTTWPDTHGGASARFWHHFATSRHGPSVQEFAPGEHKGFPGQCIWLIDPGDNGL